MPRLITEIFAFVCIDKDDDEGVPAFLTNMGVMMPLLCSDAEKVHLLRGKAEEIAKQTGASMKLVRFSAREDLEDIHVVKH